MGNSASKDPFVSQAITDIRDKATNHAQCDDVETLEEFKQELIRTRAMHLQILERLGLDTESTKSAGACKNFQDNRSILSDDEIRIAELLVSLGQQHLFDNWGSPGTGDEDKHNLCKQAQKLNSTYPGGLTSYHSKAISLLEVAAKGLNPFAKYAPEVPVGERMTFGSDKWQKAESRGIQELAHTGFVLVAGGLGERLEYNGIKIALPVQITTGQCYLGMYVSTILAYQDRAKAQTGKDVVLPLFIMTSASTHELTMSLLAKHKNFGMAEGQITCVKQEMVAAINDSKGGFAQSGPLIETKPHGHGDVHLVLHQSGVCRRWVEQGIKHIIFFQDTNGLVIHSFPALVGTTAELGLAMNSLTCPRRPGEACGAICNLVSKTGDEAPLCINVEYNVLGPMLQESTGKGDVADESGFSAYPGNINVICFNATKYLKALEESDGIVPEFVNPKLMGDGSGRFKKPTRIECMMQEYSRLLRGEKVGCTEIARWSCFSAVKNNLTDATKKFKSNGIAECAASGEADHYYWYRAALRHLGVVVPEGDLFESTPGIKVKGGARLVFSPDMGVTLAELATHFPNPKAVKISPRSTLVLEGNVVIESLELDGCLVVNAVAGATATLRGLKVKNAGETFVECGTDNPEYLKIRGYKMQKGEQRVIQANGDMVVSK